MASVGINAYYPVEKSKTEQKLPHIFTELERKEFFNAVDSYHPKTTCDSHRRLALEYKVFFRLIYCCGLRNGEACNLRRDDIDTKNGTIRIIESKGDKDRLIFMSEDLSLFMESYLKYIVLTVPQSEWFFPGNIELKPLLNTTVDRVFESLWMKTMSSRTCNDKPTVHDLRFSFVTERINLWVSENVNVDLMMPYLSKYLGHKSVSETYYYYHTTKQLFDGIRSKDSRLDDILPEVPEYE